MSNPLAPSQQSLRDVDPRGRIDVAVFRLLEMVTKKRLEPALKNRPLWDSGLGDLVDAAITESGVFPSQPITARDVIRELFGGRQRRLR